MFKRVDSLGHYVFKYSDDHGRSWSAERYDVPVRLFACDRENVYAGKLCFFWNVGRPLILRDGTALFVLHKVGAMGEGFFARSEGCFLHSDNLLTERDPARIRFATLPDGETGLRTPPGGGRVAEEQSVVQLSDGTLYCVYRTVDGWPVCAYSHDAGHSWTPPAYKTYAPAGDRRVKHPRAANFVWRCANGHYLYWFHNHGGAVIRRLSETHSGSPYDDRNPVWLLAGREIDALAGRRLEWSEPEIVLYEDDPFIRMSYPDLVEEGGAYFLTETNKDVARVHPVDPALLEGLFNQWSRCDVARDDLLLELPAAGAAMPTEVAMPVLPDFMTRDHTSLRYGRKDLRQGFSIELAFRLESLSHGQIILDSRTPTGKGIALQTTARGAVEIVLNDGRSENRWDCDPGVLTVGQPQHWVVTVDGGPRIITFVVNGHLCDGGEDRQFGWGRFSPNLFNVTGSHRLRIAPTVPGSVTRLRLYGRALRTSEAVAAWRAGDPGTLKSVVLPDDRATP